MRCVLTLIRANSLYFHSFIIYMYLLFLHPHSPQADLEAALAAKDAAIDQMRREMGGAPVPTGPGRADHLAPHH